jgi:hypothetical protein
MVNNRIGLATVFAAMLGAPVALHAQITGSVTGVVVDSSGGVVSGAKATLKSLETGAERTDNSDSQGRVNFNLLQIGQYELRVEASGFRVALAQAEVKAGEITSLRIPVEVGAVTETVRVTGAAAILDVENAQMQISIVGEKIQEMPTRRDPNGFAITAPGTAPVSGNNPFLGSGSFNVNGMRGRGNNIVVDGITSTDVSVTGTGGPLNPLNFSSIKEVKVITNNFSAEYGRNMGAQVLYLTKNGTNDLHGEFYEYFRNDKLNARGFFDTSGKASILRRNQYGFEFGGPVYIPKLYNGRNKTFWHVDWEQLKQRGASAPRIARVPTPTMVAQVTDPTAKALLDQYKIPTSASGSITTATGVTTNSYQAGFRVDQNIGSRDTLWVRYSQFVNTTASAGNTFINSNLPGFGATSANRPKQATLAETHTFGSTMVNEFRFGFGQSLPSFPIDTPYPLGPRIQFTSAEVDRFGVWEGLPQGREQRTFQYNDNFSFVVGRHTFKAGGEWYHLEADSVFDSNFRPLITFTNWTAFASGTPTTVTQNFGNSVRENRINNFFAFFQDDWKVSQNLTLNLGIREEWAGGPVEKNGMISNLNFENKTAYGAAGSGPFGLLETGKPSFRSNNNWAPRVGFAWAPGSRKTVIRGGYGIAYDFIFLNPITNQRFLPPFIVSGAQSGNFTGDNSLARIVAGTSAFQDGFRSQVGKLSTTVTNFGAIAPAIDQDLRNPQAHQWNFGLQREVRGIVLKASYVGTKGNYLIRSRNLNLIANRIAPATSVADETARLSQFTSAQTALDASPAGRSIRIDPRYNNITYLDDSANSNYHALQIEAERRFGALFLHTNYTWGKSIDDGSDALGVLINDSSNQQDPTNNRNNRAASQFDLRGRLVLAHSWALPWLKDSSNPILKHALGGWNFAGITTFRTGFPVTLDAGGRRGITLIPLVGGSGTGQIRPNATGPLTIDWIPTGAAGSPNALNSDPTVRISSYAERLGLSQPLLGNFGNLGRNTFRLNGERNFDWNVFKNFRLAERASLQVRAEMYNALNNTTFQDVQRNITSAAFGTYTTTAQDQRVIQLGARIVF